MDSQDVVLVVLCGLNTAFVTESAWALSKGLGCNPIAASAVHVITTGVGKAQLCKELLDEGVWTSMKTDLAGADSDLRFSADNIHVFADEAGVMDFKRTVSPAGQEGVARTILKVLGDVKSRRGRRLVFCMSGGYKTLVSMGVLAFCGVARRDDAMYHVLVDDPFDKDKKVEPRFFYPKPGETYRQVAKVYSGEDANLRLLEMPAVRYGALLSPGSALEGLWDLKKYADKTIAASRTVTTACICLATREFCINGKSPIKFSKPQAWVLSSILKRKFESENMLKAYLSQHADGDSDYVNKQKELKFGPRRVVQGIRDKISKDWKLDSFKIIASSEEFTYYFPGDSQSVVVCDECTDRNSDDDCATILMMFPEEEVGEP